MLSFKETLRLQVREREKWKEGGCRESRCVRTAKSLCGQVCLMPGAVRSGEGAAVFEQCKRNSFTTRLGDMVLGAVCNGPSHFMAPDFFNCTW